LSRTHPRLTALAFATLALICAAPLVLESTSFQFLEPYPAAWQTVLTCAAVLFALFAVVGLRAFLDRPAACRRADCQSALHAESHPLALHVLFVAVAVAMTFVHWQLVDYHPYMQQWQRELYVGLFRHTYDPPHQYRPLPFGFVRSLERLTHDYEFSCLAYRAFFSYWFVWAWYRLARTVHPPPIALLTLTVLLPLYPLSIMRYLGQLTDPMSHALFVLALLWVAEDRPFALAAALALGVGTKETAVIVVPGYLAAAGLQGRKGFGAAAVIAGCLGIVCALAFLAARVPFGWRPGQQEMNGAGLMVGTNVGIGDPIAGSPVPLWENYLHPVLFVLFFVPLIAWHWRDCDLRLRALFVTVTPLLLASNLCYGWLYESRNYVPLLPLLATLALPGPVRSRFKTGERGA
jgi:hypothetical protein